MAKERGQRKAKDKWKEKNWYTIVAPDYFSGKELSMGVGSTPESMIGRKIEIPVSDLNGNFKKANARMIFQVTSCQGNRCETEFMGHTLSDDYIRRMVRRRKERIDIVKSFTTQTHDNVTVKLVIVTDGKLTGSKKVEIRNAVEEELTNKISAMSYGDFAKYVINDDIYSDIVNATKDIYPVRKIEIRKSVKLSAQASPVSVGANNSEAGVEQVS
jgi:small subunit ribosomal protein S3Ae